MQKKRVQKCALYFIHRSEVMSISKLNLIALQKMSVIKYNRGNIVVLIGEYGQNVPFNSFVGKLVRYT